MKTIATLIFVLFIGGNAKAQNTSEEVKVDSVKTTVVSETSFESVTFEPATELARLYKRANTRVKKELTFSTKANRAKMA